MDLSSVTPDQPLNKLTVEPTHRLQKLPAYVFAWLDELKALARARGADLIDLGMGNPDQPVPQPVIAAMKTALDDPKSHGYPPFKGTDAFRETMADWMQRRYGVSIDPAKEVLCLSGSKEGLADITRAYIDEGDVSLVPDIYYPVLSRATWLVGGEVVHLPITPENQFLPDLSAIPQSALDKAKLLFLNYPNNPTGAVAPLSYYEEAVAFCRRHNLVLVSDLAYGEITFEGYVAASALQVPGAMDVTVEFHSCSKSFNMAGDRIGFAVGSPNIIATLYALRTNGGYGTPVTMQAGAIAAFEHAETYLKPTVDTYKKRLDVLVEGFQRLGWDVTAPLATLYLWLKVPKGFSSQAWTEYLIATADVVVTPGNAFGPGGEGYFRISLVSPVEALHAALARLEAKGIRYVA